MAQVVRSTKSSAGPASRSTRDVARAARQRRKQIVSKIPAKRGLTRVAAKVGLATGWYLWRGVRASALIAAKGSQAAGTKVAGHARTVAQERYAKRSQHDRSKPIACACGARFRTVQAANEHMVRKHFDEAPAWLEVEQPAKTSGVRLVAGKRGKSGRKEIVLPEQRRNTPGAHRARPDKKPAKVIIAAAYRKHLDQIGATVMSENGPARNIAQAFDAWGDQRPKTLGGIKGVCVGMERALTQGKEALDAFERYLNRPGEAGGLGVDPSVSRASFRKAQEGLESTQRAMTMFIATFEHEYGVYIQKARTLPPPAVDLAR